MAKNKDGNFDARCTSTPYCAKTTKNKIYFIRNGKLTLDNGKEYPGYIKDIDHLNCQFIAKFELVEKPKRSELKRKIKQLKSELATEKTISEAHNKGLVIASARALEDVQTIETLKEQVENLTIRNKDKNKNIADLTAECVKYKCMSNQLQVAVDRRNKRIKGLHEALDKTRFPTWVDKLFDVDEKRKKQLKAIRYIQNKKIAVHCDTREKEIVFVNLAREVFGSGFNVTASGFDVYGNEVCKVIKSRMSQYSDKVWYNNKGYKIIEFDDLETFSDTIED